ncbi:unnamed protein product [Miscanthus lutarioriparius]|uniref:Uncharacterized protein n=1 Tax=Miscanthus lutarioriparius TaxID=422564 RepID=A0A811NZE8_9POAL|nr:unnamed protein product [Miscanthus lutarioriparius]
MSCSSPPPLEHHHDAGRTRAPALDLLDEYWFFSNTLVTNNSAKKKTPPHLPRSPSTSTATGTGTGTGEKASASAGPPSRLGGRRLLRTPSLPTSRVGMTTMELPLPTNKDDDDDLVHQDGAGAAASASASRQPQRRQLQAAAAAAAADEVDDDDLNWSSIYEGVLRTRMAEGGGRSALHRAPSMPVPSSATATDHHHHGGGGRRQTKSTPSMLRLLRHSHSTLGRHTPPTATKHQAEQRMPSAVARCSKKQTTSGFQFQDKKWKRSSDLESIEVQEELRASLADVLPGLKQQTKSKSQSQSQGQSSSSSPRRPYLSEAWQQVRRPALARVQSAAEMKDQLRMWAQAVACNVRQEC